MSSRARCCIKELVNLDFKHNIKIGFLSSTLCVSLIGLNHWIYLKNVFLFVSTKKIMRELPQIFKIHFSISINAYKMQSIEFY